MQGEAYKSMGRGEMMVHASLSLSLSLSLTARKA